MEIKPSHCNSFQPKTLSHPKRHQKKIPVDTMTRFCALDVLLMGMVGAGFVGKDMRGFRK